MNTLILHDNSFADADPVAGATAADFDAANLVRDLVALIEEAQSYEVH